MELSRLLRHGDRALILAQRLLEQITHAPEIEEDMALANLALDLLGQARVLYTLAGEVEGGGHDEDHFAYWRDAAEFTNPVLVEQPNTDFAHVIVRQYLHDEFALAFWQAAGWDVAAKAVKETTYHRRHSRAWLVRLGDGTPESHRRAQAALDTLWPYVDELFAGADQLRPAWDVAVAATLAEATLAVPQMLPAEPIHEHLESILAELQVTARAHPGATW
ncbi:MAG TPA: 1,2-phenylacetyl-CoA epoxidase subunit PaaC [Ilumatobacter sp.]|nr:1,2-phenylacetyl-CoA epoxidase subunit PaaC [Ilumatobacter sp.]